MRWNEGKNEGKARVASLPTFELFELGWVISATVG
jgi:hypothetical protein